MLNNKPTLSTINAKKLKALEVFETAKRKLNEAADMLHNLIVESEAEIERAQNVVYLKQQDIALAKQEIDAINGTVDKISKLY